MDRSERYENQHITLLNTIMNERKDVWTALPGVITSFDKSTLTCNVQPTIQAKVTDRSTDTTTWENLPELLDCPVFYPSGGGFTLTFPIKEGDECLVVFSSRCIDSWWDQGGVQPQGIMRMHDLSDGIVFCGIRSKPRATIDVMPSASLISDDGNTYIHLSSDKITLKASSVEIQSDLINLGGIIFSTHKHSDPQGGVTGVPQ